MGENAVNVQKTMHDLVAVGKLLQIADLGSDSLKSNVVVKGNIYFNLKHLLWVFKIFLEMMMNYQSMVHDSTVTLFKFRDNCRTAIENHVLAIQLYNEHCYADCLIILADNKVNSLNDCKVEKHIWSFSKSRDENT